MSNFLGAVPFQKNKEEIIVIGKNNKKLKELKQGVKVESYSIKKFKFGAASIVIGASIFFGTGVASANEVAASSDSSATNDTNATSGNGDKIPEKINTVSAEKENVASVNKPSSVKEESTKVEVEKKVVDKSLLETSITKLEELLATVNKDKAPASTLSAVNVDLINAKSILENANASQEEVDALVKKLKQQTQIVSSMPKVTTKEKEVKEGANTIANSGSRDARNGAAIPVGTTLRADAGATYDNAVGLYFTKEGDGSGYPAGTMLFRDRNQNTADKQRVKDVKDVVKVDVTKNGDTYNWEIEFDRDPENHKNAHAWFTIPNGHTLVNDGSASFGSYWGGSGGKRRIETKDRLPRNLQQIFENQVAATTKVTNYGTPGGHIEWAFGKATKDGFWHGADGVVKTLEEIISKPDSQYWNRTGGARTTTDKDVLLSDYLKDWLIQHTQRVYHFEIDYRGKTKDSTSNYIFRFKTKAAEGTPLMYAAGMRSYEFNTHRNDMQWYGLPSPKVTGADQTIEKGKDIRLEFTTKDNLAGFSLGDPKLGYNTADSIKLVDSKLELKD